MEPWQLDDDEFDSPAEIDGVFRAQRRLSLIYGGIFVAVTMSIPVLGMTSSFWTAEPLVGGFTLNYLVVAVFYHFIYMLLGTGYALQSNRLEQEFLGRRRQR